MTMNAVGGLHLNFKDHVQEVLLKVYADTNEKLAKVVKIIMHTAKAECPVGRTGALKRSIRTRLYPQERTGRVIVGNKKAWYPHIVLFGTVLRSQYIRGKLHGRGRLRIGRKHNTGTMPPNNFMERAVRQNEAEIRSIFGKKIKTIAV